MAVITRKTKAMVSWTEVADWIKSGQAAKKLSVGDEIKETLTTGEKVVIVVAGINLYSENQVIFSFKDCLKNQHRMNPNYTNAGGWKDCEMRQYLNNNFIADLPEELQAVITPRKFNGDTEDKLWLFSLYEIFGEDYNWCETDPHDKHIPYYKMPINRCKPWGKGGSSANLWWLRSPYATYTLSFCFVNNGGTASNYFASISFGVAPGFCI